MQYNLASKKLFRCTQIWVNDNEIMLMDVKQWSRNGIGRNEDELIGLKNKIKKVLGTNFHFFNDEESA